MKKLVVLTLLLCGCACSERQLTPAQEKELVESKIHYFKDSRTGLCFANGWGGDYHGGPYVTNVPCSPEVEKLLDPNVTAFRYGAR